MPTYLKEDFPNPAMLPCKELISNMPAHVDRPSADKFDQILNVLYRKVGKRVRKSGQLNRRNKLKNLT